MTSSSGRPIGPPAAPVTVPPPHAAAVAAAFGLGDPTGPPTFAARGELGRIWRLETTRGTWAVKVLLHPPDRDEVAADLAFQQVAIGAGIPMPAPVLAEDGSALAAIPGTGYGSGRGSDPGARSESGAGSSDSSTSVVRVHTWVDLVPGPVSAPPASAAAILGTLHAAAPADASPIDPWFTDVVPAARWSRLAEQTTAIGAAWAALLSSRVADIVATAPVIEAAEQLPIVTCHRDYNPQNVLLTVDGSPVVVDWENSGPAAAERELAGAIAEFEVPLADVEAFLTAYEAGGGARTTLSRASFAGVLAIQNQLLEHYASKALDASLPQEERDRSAFWLDDILTHLFSVERVQRWVDAAAAVGW